MTLFRPAWLALTAFLLLSPPTLATTVVRQGVDSLADGADVVVRGIVEGVEGHAELNGQPFRLTRVRVVETLAGHAPAMLAIRLPGGASLDGTPRLAAGVPEFAVGDEVVLFLARVSRDVTQRPSRAAGGELVGSRGRVAPASGPPAIEQWMPISLALGTYHVQRAEGAVLAVQDPQARGMAVAGSAPADGDAPASIALEDLGARVKARRAQQGRP